MSTDIQNSEVFHQLQQQADQGDGHACAKVGHIFATGDSSLGIAPDHALSIQYYEKGAQTGNLPCKYGLAAASMAEQPDKAISLLEDCARQNYVWSLATLGDLYLRGRHVTQDSQKACQYLEQYTTLCRPDTVGEHTFKVRWDLVLYPICLLLGIGCQKDEAKAMKVLKELADLGNLSASDTLHTGKLNDWMAAKRFNFDTKTNGPVFLFNPATQLPATQTAAFAARPPRINNPQYQVVHKEHLDRFLQRTLIPDEPILMRGVFPRIYTVDSVLWLLAFLLTGRWVEHLMALHGNELYAALPDKIYAFLYQYPQLPVVVFGLVGLFIFLQRMIRKWTTEIVLTNKRFIYKHGLFHIEMVQMNFWQIEHSDVTQSMLGSWLDYGRVRIQSWALQHGEDPASQHGALVLPLISHPYLFSRLIEDNRQLPYKSGQQGQGGGQQVPMPMWGGMRH